MATINTTGNVTKVEYSNEKETFPISVAATSGTISTGTRKDFIVGVGTVFTTDLQKGDYIWDTTNDELIEVEGVVSDTEIYLKKEFTNALSGTAAWKIVPRVHYTTISWAIDSGGAASINTISFPTSTSESYNNDKPYGQGGGRRLAPILIDCTTNANTVNISAN